jgi:hypothetical protein
MKSLTSAAFETQDGFSFCLSLNTSLLSFFPFVYFDDSLMASPADDGPRAIKILTLGKPALFTARKPCAAFSATSTHSYQMAAASKVCRL